MTQARTVIADQNSQELDELRRQFNNLLIILEKLAIELDATTITAVQFGTALKQTLANGLDTDASPHVGTQRELNGVHPTPTHPKRPHQPSTITMVAGDKY